MDNIYKKKMKEELSFYDGSLKAHLLGYISYKKYMYIKLLRTVEYYGRKKDVFSKLIVGICKYRLRKYGLALGFQIPPHTVGWGLKIYHFGHIIINYKAKIGENCVLYPGINVGANKNGVPTIGDNCTLFLGAKISGGAIIGDNCVIAPNAVVTKSFPQGTVIGGINNILNNRN